MLLSNKNKKINKPKKNNNNNKQTIKKKKNKQATIKQTKTATTYNNPCLHQRSRCFQAIALNDQQVAPNKRRI